MSVERRCNICIIAVVPAGQTITRRTLKNCFTGNSDGAGIMWAYGGRLWIEKGFFGFRKFYKRFRQLEAVCPKSNFVLHFRIATSGGIRADTCHPFSVHDKLAFVHNGIFSNLGTTALSDTQIFNQDILQQLPPNFLEMRRAKKEISDYITTSLSKVVFLDNKGEYTIINEEHGSWDEGLWFSNYSYLPASYYSTKYYDDAYYNAEYAGCASTRKRCIICSCWTDIEKIEYESDISFEGKKQSGWICSFCQDFIGAIHVCNGCGQLKPRRDLYRNQYGEMICDECLLINNTYAKEYSTDIGSDKICYDCGSPNIYYSASDGYLCESCYNRTKDDIANKEQGTCPVCGMIVHLSEDDAYKCPCCQVYLDKDEYLENANETGTV